ncbi:MULTISPECIES: EutP/PduV family microcompartment system protein [unclassified Enterococcus]|uniref:EutP/PduV family microcompartment system protein n=1 Tax=unclassified Enterococcus TaxID=2608891 RepID=UPI001CE1FADE|nr:MULTISPECIES: EutP/PduV family microcompartment system protein [unclassified Enterococcus]MCA5013498.1 EutP/PduV family microcompartment system protein [Enterococcus sp. S23]MCA5016748.1 EutP/PduV family microcompartment system protein [Enterococcus sp. S22(2020)]
MKKAIFIGSVGCGKTTLSQKLKGEELAYNKTQAIEFHDQIIDTPGEFIQHRNYYSALLTTAVEAELIVLMASAVEKRQTFSPLFASSFAKPCIGIITKIDLATEEDLKQTKRQLELAGAKKIFMISAVEDQGIDELLAYLESDGGDKNETLH